MQEASLKAEQFRSGPGSLSFIGHEHITKAAGLKFIPAEERAPQVDYKGI